MKQRVTVTSGSTQGFRQTAHAASRASRDVRRPSKHDFHLAARAGYAARGIIYILVGALAALAALGQGGGTTGSRGALSQLLDAPFGAVMLVAIAIGLLCYAAWRAIQAFFDADGHGTDAKAILIRGGLAVSAVIHVGLAFFALSLVFGLGTGQSGGQSSDSASQEWTAWLLSQPFGQWLVGLVGIAIIGAGVAHFVKAWTAKFEQRFEMSAQEREIITPVSRFGLFARGVAFLLIGGFFIVAAWQQDPGEARGLSGALDALQQQPYGWALLGLLAIGLVAFGLYSVIESVYRRVNMPA